jgi:hypothetical protein
MNDPVSHGNCKRTRRYQVVRPPAPPARDKLSDEDRVVHDALVARLNEYYGAARVDVNIYAKALLNSPPLATAIFDLAWTMVAAGKRGDGFSDHEREYVNMVLSFDAGHYELVVHHLQYGGFERAGVRPDAVAALWEGRADDLLPNERQLVDYVRAVVSGRVTNDVFEAIVTRFGQRGAIEYTIAIGFLLMAMTLMRAFDVPSASREELKHEIDRLHKGPPE